MFENCEFENIHFHMMLRSLYEKSALHAENYKYYYVIKQHIFFE